MGPLNPLNSPDFHLIGLIFSRLVCQYVWHVRSLFQSNLFTPLLYQGIFWHVELLIMVKSHLELVKTLVLQSHLKDIFCLQMYALLTLAHVYIDIYILTHIFCIWANVTRACIWRQNMSLKWDSKTSVLTNSKWISTIIKSSTCQKNTLV